MEVPPYLLDQVRAGKVVLFLGAGASIGAHSSIAPFSPPVANQLVGLLSDKFLGGREKDKSLAVVAEYCIARADLMSVQAYIAEIFGRFDPGPTHLLIPKFKWAALVTTNYDQVVERAYSNQHQRLQNPVPFLRNSDRVDSLLRNAGSVPFIKLHGCISNASDANHPLILTTDQYVTHRSGRDKLFSRFKEYAGEYTVVYVGYRLEDPDIRAVLLDLEDPQTSRPRHYVVAPTPSELDSLVWEKKQISVLAGTFSDFLAVLNTEIPEGLRRFVSQRSTHPIESRFVSHAELSNGAVSFLSNDVTYVHGGMASEKPDPTAFYKGASYGWSAIIAVYDAHRFVTDAILTDTVLDDGQEKSKRPLLLLLKGYAGAGKTVTLKRLAYETGVSFDKPALYLRSDAKLAIDPIEEICNLTKERLYIFIDGVARRAADVEQFIKQARHRAVPVTVVVAERTAEWNTECEELSSMVEQEYEMRALSLKEIDGILLKLTEHNALGTLAGQSPQQRQAAFLHYADRQLLVALYEVTSGLEFRDIVFNEYKNIPSATAKRIYLVICALNRLNVPVRAGIVKRLTGVSFERFKSEFFAPLESIVLTEDYKPALDMAYRARHPWIAQVVFQRALVNELERFDLYIGLLSAIDTGYTADRSAYRELIRAKHLLELFPSPNLVDELFRTAEKSNDRDGYLFQQQAIYEMKRANPNLRTANELLTKAQEALPNDKSIIHSFSELELLRAQSAKSDIERENHTRQAKAFAEKLVGKNADSSHGYMTLARIELERLKTTMRMADSKDDEVAAAVKAVEQRISAGLEKFSNDEHLLVVEAEFSSVLRDEARALAALRAAHKVNPGSPFVARALSRALDASGDPRASRDVLDQSLKLLPGDRQLNAALARLIEEQFAAETGLAEAAWRRSFTPGDTNYYSQFWYARRLYLNGKIDEAKAIFLELKNARVSRQMKLVIVGWIRDEGRHKIHSGKIERVEDSYCLITPNGQAARVFLSRSEASNAAWTTLRVGNTVSFRLGFNFFGPAASMKY
jgi:hypothetical protein